MSFAMLSSAIGKINFFGEWLDYMRLRLRDQILTLGVRFIETLKEEAIFNLRQLHLFTMFLRILPGGLYGNSVYIKYMLELYSQCMGILDIELEYTALSVMIFLVQLGLH